MTVTALHIFGLIIMGVIVGAPLWIFLFAMLTHSPEIDQPHWEDNRNDEHEQHYC